MSQQGQRFRRRALRRGYKVDEVDEFLDRVESTLAGNPLGAPVASRDVHDFVFRVRFGGYDEWQVDMHLDRVERQLAALEENGGMPPAEPAQLPAGRSGYPLPPGESSLGPRHDDVPPSPRRDEPTMVRPARAAASVPPPEPGMPASGAAPVRPTSGAPMPGAPGPAEGTVAPGPPRHPRPQPTQPPTQSDDFTQKLPPVSGGFEPAADFQPTGGRRFERETPRYEPELSRHEPGRYEPEPGRYDPEAQHFEPEPPRFESRRGAVGYEPPHPGYAPEPRHYEPEPQRFEPAGPDAQGRFERMEQQPQGYEPSFGQSGGTRFETGFEPGRHGKVDMTTEIRAADSPFTPEDLQHLDQMRRTFQVRRFGSGYDPAQVNRLFDAIAATMSGRATVQVSDGELDPSQFSLVQGGLFEAEVDGALREVRELFARRGITR